MVKQFVETFKRVRREYKIKALNEVIEKATKLRTKAKNIALKAQAERDALIAQS